MRHKTTAPTLTAVVLLAGCMTETAITEDVAGPADSEVPEWSTDEVALASFPDEAEDK